MKLARWLWLALLPIVALAQMQIDRVLGGFRAQEEVLLVWSGEHIRRVLPGFRSLMADVYWLRTVQYYGGQRAFSKEKRYDLLDPLAEITTTLDPKFEIAYRYGAVFLCEPYPEGAGRPDAGVALLRKGTRENPDSWLLWQHLGYFQFFYLHDAHGAAASLLDGAKLPGAPTWLSTLAADILRQEGDRRAARAVWRSMLAGSEEEPIRRIARRNLARLDAADGIDALAKVVEEFRRRAGRNPAGWEELRAAGLLRGQPVDPSGWPLTYDPASGRFSIALDSDLGPGH